MFLGVGQLPATVEFSPGLTVIYGASETGKSYIEKSVDYTLGASELKPIPEDEGYSRILLRLRVDDGRALKRSRGPADSTIAVFNCDLRQLTTAPADATLSYKHSSTSQRNIYRYLLKVLGIDGLTILRNSRGEVRRSVRRHHSRSGCSGAMRHRAAGVRTRRTSSRGPQTGRAWWSTAARQTASTPVDDHVIPRGQLPGFRVERPSCNQRKTGRRAGTGIVMVHTRDDS
ncbi:hypothetical protein [Streptomyces himalayensis]|uniref:Uncharacterized protein n=1 Tax=Streptomyces himalayensis subsp. himalayensis TaxID=2756131 RepID=A0A7W0DV68_9ACTN|nr:hypothetical protein [Streptomyces himalayensis]MBA2951886.1 hypothetical protein [Streptomyces himalayensis subsp. himalayensis]